MMSNPVSKIEEEAIGWFIRVRDPAFADWDGFTAWLERDAAHASAYDEVAIADEGFEEAGTSSSRLQGSIVVPEVGKPHRSAKRPGTRRQVLGWVAAASVLGATSLALLNQGPATYSVETAAGEQRTINLADGSKIDLNGNSKIILDRENGRVAEVERGEALFTVVHDERSPFEVRTGGDTIVDVGTVFNVLRTGSVTDVAVAEGAILFNPQGQAVALSAGKRLRASDRQARVEVSTVDPEAVTAWSAGHLIYDQATLGLVAADLSRNLGVGVRVEPAIAQKPFSGVIQLEPDVQSVSRRLGPLLGVAVKKVGTDWVLAPEDKSEN